MHLTFPLRLAGNYGEQMMGVSGCGVVDVDWLGVELGAGVLLEPGADVVIGVWVPTGVGDGMIDPTKLAV